MTGGHRVLPYLARLELPSSSSEARICPCENLIWVVSSVIESCHVCVSHVTYSWVVSRMNESCYLCMSRIQCIIETCHVWMSHVSWAAQQVPVRESNMSHVTYEWVMSHMNELCHIWTSHVTYECLIPHTIESFHIWMRHTFWAAQHLPVWESTMSHVISRAAQHLPLWEFSMSHVT